MIVVYNCTTSHRIRCPDIVDNGIVLTGGGALLKNLDKCLKEATGMPIIVAEDPLSSVVLGSGKALDNLDILREVTIE